MTEHAHTAEKVIAVKNLPAMQELMQGMWVQPLRWENPLEDGERVNSWVD